MGDPAGPTGVHPAHPQPGSFDHAPHDAVVAELRGRDCDVRAHRAR